jgi:hypothetical protein
MVIIENISEKMENQMLLLKEVAYDADHLNYMKSMASTQPITLPITLLHGITEEMVPVLEDVFRCETKFAIIIIYAYLAIYYCLMFIVYGKNLGHDHNCTHKAGQHYIRMRRRVGMYNKISGGSSFSKLDEEEFFTTEDVNK